MVMNEELITSDVKHGCPSKDYVWPRSAMMNCVDCRGSHFHNFYHLVYFKPGFRTFDHPSAQATTSPLQMSLTESKRFLSHPVLASFIEMSWSRTDPFCESLYWQEANSVLTRNPRIQILLQHRKSCTSVDMKESNHETYIHKKLGFS